VSLIVQSILGHTEISWDGESTKHRAQYFQEVGKIFKSINTLIRCIIDCQIVLGDSVTIQNAMMLERSLGSKAWDDSPMQMIQIPEIGNVAVRKLVNAGIRSLEDLEATDARRIETIVGKNPPFGLRILVSLHVQQASVSATTNANDTPADQMVRSQKPQMASKSM
jgi:ATP-dependent DNA helicase HFM1/MER3